MGKCVKCGRLPIEHVPNTFGIKIVNNPGYMCPSCRTEDKIIQNLENKSLDRIIGTKPMPKCVKCGGVFGLYTYNEELWCPKCLVARIQELESLLKEIWLEDSGKIGTIRKGPDDKRRFISTDTGYVVKIDRKVIKTIDFTDKGVEIRDGQST